MNVLISEAVWQDIFDAADFYEDQDAGLGIEVIDFMIDKFAELSALAGIHPHRHHTFRWVMRGRFPHFISFYRINGDQVQVLGVYDGRRDPDWITQSLAVRLSDP